MLCAYPMMLDINGRVVVIVGGGAVAARKAAGVLEAGARDVRVVAPRVTGSFAPNVKIVTEEYRPQHLDSAGLIFAATDDPTINAQVVRDARARGVLVCRADADADDPGDFATPAKFREGSVIVAVSASGNPALAAMVRDRLWQRFDRRWSAMADAMATLRPAIRAMPQAAQPKRAEVFRSLASDDAMAALDAGGIDALREWLASRFPELK